MPAGLREQILASSYYRSGDPFKATDIRKVLRMPCGKRPSMESLRLALRSMAQEGEISIRQDRGTNKEILYTKKNGLRTLLSRKWRAHTDEGLGIAV